MASVECFTCFDFLLCLSKLLLTIIPLIRINWEMIHLRVYNLKNRQVFIRFNLCFVAKLCELTRSCYSTDFAV